MLLLSLLRAFKMLCALLVWQYSSEKPGLLSSTLPFWDTCVIWFIILQPKLSWQAVLQGCVFIILLWIFYCHLSWWKKFLVHMKEFFYILISLSLPLSLSYFFLIWPFFGCRETELKLEIFLYIVLDMLIYGFANLFWMWVFEALMWFVLVV